MLRKSTFSLALIFSLCSPRLSHSQATDPETAFRNAVVNQRFFLRVMSADRTVKFEWDGSGLRATAPKVHTLAAITPDSVKVSPGKIEIKGLRKTLVKASDGKYAFAGGSYIILSIALGTASASDVLPVLKDQLFFTSLKDALAEIPHLYVNILPYQEPDPMKPEVNRYRIPFDCRGGDIKAPHLVTMGSNASSLTHNYQGIKGSSVVIFTIDETGHPGDIWLAGPFGDAFDEEIEQRIPGYEFTPATCSGVPIKFPEVFDWRTHQ